MSHHLKDHEAKGLMKAGDRLIPGGKGFPSFSESGVIRDADRMLAYMAEEDRSGLLLLLGCFYFLPILVISLLLKLTEWNRFFPEPLGGMLRLVGFGVKGTIYTLYYSDPNIHSQIHWDAKIVLVEAD